MDATAITVTGLRTGWLAETHATLRLAVPMITGQLAPDANHTIRGGGTVVFGYRVQAFVTRAYTAGITGLSTAQPKLAGIWSADGSPATWPA